MPNIKLKDLYGDEQTYEGIDTVAALKSDGSGKEYFVKRPVLNFTLQDPPAHEPAVTEGDFFVWNVGDGPLSGEHDDGNILGVVAPAVEGKTTKPILYISVSQPVSGVTVNASGDARLVYLYEALSGAMLKEVIDFNGTTDFTAEVGWGQLLLDDSGSVTGYAKITEPGGVVIGILQPMGILNADVFYAAFSETTQESQSVEVTENGPQTIVPTAGKSGIRKVALNVNVPSSGGNLQEKSVSITSNGSTEVTPDAGYDGMSKVTAVVNVAGGGGGVQANWAQNDSTAADYVKNRPGAYIQTVASHTLTFDGDVTGKLQDGGFVKISDEIIPKEALQSGTFTVTIHKTGGTEVVTVSGAELYDELGLDWTLGTEETGYLLVITKEYETITEAEVVAGTYLGCDTENNPPQWYVSEFATIPEYSVTAELPEAYTQVKQADWAAVENNMFGPTAGVIKNRVGGFIGVSTLEIMGNGITIRFDGTYEGKEHYNIGQAVLVKALDYPLTKTQLKTLGTDLTITYKGTDYANPETVVGFQDNVMGYTVTAEFTANDGVSSSLIGLVVIPGGCGTPIVSHIPPGTYWFIRTDLSPVSYFKEVHFGVSMLHQMPSEFLETDFSGRDVSAKSVILESSTANSAKKFKITVDDTGTLKATEVTN